MAGIEIHGNEASRYLTVSLKDVLPCLHAPDPVQWRLLSLQALGSEEAPILDEFENEVNHSPHGVPITLQRVQQLADTKWQIVNLLLLGSTEAANLRRYEQEEEMYQSCEYVIEVFDSSYFIVHSSDAAFIACLSSQLEGVKFIA